MRVARNLARTIRANGAEERWWDRLHEQLAPEAVLRRAMRHDELAPVLRGGLDDRALPDEVRLYRKRNWKNLLRGLKSLVVAKELRIPHFYGVVQATVHRGLGLLNPELALKLTFGLPLGPEELTELGFPPVAFGTLSLRLVTTAGVGYIVDAFQNLTEAENMKYHAIGTGTTAEATGDTALVTELTTQYNPDNTRATGTTTEGASANIYRTVGTNTVDASATIAEHMVTSQAATGGGVCLDRSQFTGIALASGDSLQTTYDGTFSAGG